MENFVHFLIASMKHFLLNEWDKQQAQKRGGGRKILSIDFAEADSRYRNEPPPTNDLRTDFRKTVGHDVARIAPT